jgi:hypothetical protein
MVARRSRSVLYERELAMNETLRYHELAPPPYLRPYVRCVWRLSGSASAVSVPEPIIPDGCVELVINAGDPFLRSVPGAGSHQQPARLVAGARRVQALFRDEVGLTPKQLLRINRFQKALGIARTKPDLSWSAIASAAGYFDQAHLIHESRHIAGCTPAALLGRDAELTDVFLAG